ncbi:MAG: hypothetical protein IT201_09900 [Thermoleophilia bacterium]|nr:hypothetical protein [Thermoleophilia bacterium]
MVRGAMRLLLAAVAAVLALLPAASAHAISREEANAVALETLRPETLTSPVIVFGLPRALRASEVVSEFARAGLLKKRGRAAWLFWEDLAPGALFQHASLLLLVDDATGRVTKLTALGYYPLVNGVKPPYLWSVDSYVADIYQVYASPAPAAPAARVPWVPTGDRAPSARPLELPPGSMRGDCLLMVVATPSGDTPAQKQYEESNLKASLKAWNGLAASVGIPAYVATAGGPVEVAPGAAPAPPTYERQVTNASLDRDINKLIDDEGCTDILLYIFGHGTMPPHWQDPETGKRFRGGPAGITTGVGSPAQPGGKPASKLVKAYPLAETIGALRERATFKVVIEACFAERFDRPLLEAPNVKLLAGSSSPEEYTIGNVSRIASLAHWVKPAVPNPDRPGFTHGMVEGFKQTLADPDEVAALDSQGDSLLARLLKAAFEKEQPNDSGALNGATHPSVHENLRTTPQVEACGTWKHRGSTTDLQLYVTTKPPLAGGRVSWRVRSPIGVVAGGTGEALLDSEGKISWSIVVNRYGTYDVEITVTTPDGSEVADVQDVSIPVAAGDGTPCPAGP